MTEPEPLDTLRVAPETVEAHQLARLRAFLPILQGHHPRYRKMLRAVPISQIASLGDLDQIPLTTKADIAEDPDSFRLRTEDGSFHQPWDVIFTSGTTATPTPIHQSAYDFPRILFAQRRMAEIRGVTSSDRIANLFPLARLPNGSWLRVNDHAFAIGAQLVTGLGGAPIGRFSPTRRLPEVVRVVANADPTVLWGVPSYLRRFLHACLQSGRRLPSVRMVIASGEALGSGVSASILDMLAELDAPAAVVSPGFGASELQCSLVPCEPGAGLHNPAPELFLLQIVDDAGASLPSGETGNLVLTHLDRTGTVLVRYALGDIVELTRDKCPSCGRAGERIVGHAGRSDDKVKVRGQLVDLGGVLDLVSRDPEVVEYAAEVTRPDLASSQSMDSLLIRVALTDGADHAVALARITAVVAAAVGVTPEVGISQPDEIYAVDERMKPTRLRLEG